LIVITASPTITAIPLTKSGAAARIGAIEGSKARAKIKNFTVGIVGKTVPRVKDLDRQDQIRDAPPQNGARNYACLCELVLMNRETAYLKEEL
jgi:hypothetical protein